ncbi:MAG: autotransporter domain-containing protein [Candidatus Erginobacter occultus]|nr:autotransporter domain-containing protein [Candidatus Erginobacter occultus]
MKNLVLLIFLVIFVIAIAPARADKVFNSFSVFGDSLSTIAVSSRYSPSGYGTGNNWPYYLQAMILSPGGSYNNLAAGGATSPGILQTITSYTASNPRLDSSGLYAVFGGINDASGYAGYIASGTNALHQAGAGYILVSNLHDCRSRNPVYIERFNNDLRSRFSLTDANAIMVDTHALIAELEASPASYGFGSDTVLTDDLHYSDRTSRILAQYFNSVIQAPVQISVLPEFLGYAALLNNDRLYSLISRISPERPDTSAKDEESDPVAPGAGIPNEQKFSFFAEAGLNSFKLKSKEEFASSDMLDMDLTLGGYYPLRENLKTGLALNSAVSDGDFGDDKGDFKMFRGIISLFAELDIEETVPVTVILSQGFYSLDDISRPVALGNVTRNCTGSTTGDTTGIAVRARYNFREEDNSRFGTSLGLEYDKIAVDGYSESGETSTRMKFGSQKTDRTIGILGLYYDYLHQYSGAEVRYLLRGDYLYTFGGGSRTISARVASFDNSFEMPAYSPGDYGSVRFTLGADFILPSEFTGTCSYQFTYSDIAMINALRVGLKF